LDTYEEFLPEIALTTLSDVMPINKHLNRFVVSDFVAKFGEVDELHRQYLNTFKSEVNAKPTAEDFSFGLTPILNATQRMTSANHGAQFLIADTPEKSLEWFTFIKSLNDARKERQQTLLAYIEKHYKEYIKQPFIVIPGKFNDEFKGVLGIIAGRLADRYHKPTIVLNFSEIAREYSGSGRSTGDLNILDLLRNNPYIKNVGGHKQALGMTVTEENFNNFYLTLMEETKKIPPEVLKPKKLPLGFIPINKIDKEFFDVISRYEPFGHQYPKPTFVTRAVLKSCHLVGKQKNHLTMTITDPKGLVSFKGMQFFTTEVPEKGKEYMIYFKFGLDDFRGGDDVQLMVNDIVPIKDELQ
jgi:single-stranded-DNA-specific exonuclease